jgi:uncharacterized Zn-finger protein
MFRFANDKVRFRANDGCAIARSTASSARTNATPSVSTTSARNKAATEANAKREYQVTGEDLPLSCPMPQMSLWSSHPRVYLPIEEKGWAMCPYCAAEYRLQR